jgi:cell division protein FtsB
MTQLQILDTTIPLWGIISLAISGLGVAIWNGIKLYFNNKRMDAQIVEEKKEREVLSNRLEAVKTAFAAELDSHKKNTDKEFGRINTKLDNQKDTLTEVKTYVKLLVDDRIKKENNGKS